MPDVEQQSPSRFAQAAGMARAAFTALALAAVLVVVPGFVRTAAAHDVPPIETPFKPGDRYKPYAPDDPAYAVHYRPYVPVRAAVHHAPPRRKVVRTYRPAHHRSAHVHHHSRPVHAKPVKVAEHRHVRTKILRPRVVCGGAYNYWGPERLCQMHP